MRTIRAVFLFALLLLLPGLAAASATGTLTQGGTLNLGTAAAGDPSPDGVADFQGYAAGALTAIAMQNGAGWSYSSNSYAGSTLSDAQAQTYNTGGWIPSDYNDLGAVYYIRTGTTPNFKYFKLHTNGTNSAAGLPLLWDYLGFGVPVPPASNFSYSSYDLITDFTDTSSGGTPTTWSWTFGDSTTSSVQNPYHHHFPSAGTRSVCLTASNPGGGGGNTCKNVAVTTVTSTVVTTGNSLNVDGDGLGDLQVLSETCSVPNKIHMLNGAKYTTLSKDYRAVTTADIGGGPASTGDFCVDVDFLQPFLLKSSNGGIYKVWTAGNDVGSMRFEFALLQSAPPPAPVSSFSYATYDLIADFTDTSTGSPNAWAWTFGDAQTSTAQGPRHRYASAGTRSVCLTASNSGGAGNAYCTNVATSQRPSTTAATGSSFDFDADGKADLAVSDSGGCPVPNKLTPVNQALYALLAKDYRSVNSADAQAATYGDAPGGFCVDVDFGAPFLVLATSGKVYRAWTAANDVGSVRIEFSLLLSAERVFANGFE